MEMLVKPITAMQECMEEISALEMSEAQFRSCVLTILMLITFIVGFIAMAILPAALVKNGGR